MNNHISRELPDKFVMIPDDAEAKSFLLAIDALRNFPDERTPSNQTVCFCDYEHRTHWILALRLHGNPDPKENGYVVMAWPKTKWPRSILRDEVDRLMKDKGAPTDARSVRYGEDDTPLS